MPTNGQVVEPILCSVIDRVPILRDARDIDVAPLTGGHSNISYLVSADGAQYAVRVASAHGEILGTDRTQERVALEQAAAAGIAPEVVAFLLPEGHCVTRYLAAAQSFTVDEFTSEETIRRVALRMRDIHALDPIDRIFDPHSDIERWLAITDEHRVRRPTRLTALLDRVEASQRHLAARGSGSVLCHNDPYYRNFLDDGTLRVVDWEYAGMGDGLYDLAAIAARLGHDGREILLETYLETVDEHVRSNLEALIDVYLTWNVAWSLVRVVYSEIDFDYLGYAEQLLDIAFEERPLDAR